MQKIIQNEKNYYQEALNAIITSNTMIPGMNGKKVNRNKSYQKMKKLNAYKESLLVFDTINPKNSINNHYDKVILSGNKNIKQVSLVIKIDNNNMFDNINNILRSNNSLANILTNNNYSLSNTNFINLLNYQYNDNIDYCLTNNLEIKKECLINHKYTIFSKEINNYYLTKTKEFLENGIVLVYSFDKNNYPNLNIILKFLKNNHYDIVSIDKLINEKSS